MYGKQSLQIYAQTLVHQNPIDNHAILYCAELFFALESIISVICCSCASTRCDF